MSNATKRSILRVIHIVLAIPIMGYIYSPYENLPQYSGPTRYVFFPLIALTGFWMWLSPAVKRMLFKRSG